MLFLQGGASLQFSMVPMNLLPAGGSADYIVTGAWSQKAVKEAKRVGGVKIAATTEAENFARVPRQDELTLDPDAAYVHIHDEQHDLRHGVPVTCRTSAPCRSSPTRRPTSSAARSTSSKYALIYAGAQKNLAPAGVTLVIIRDDMLKRTPSSLPTMLQYGVHVENKSMYNTPPVFAIYIMRLVLAWLLKQGGLDGDRDAQRAQGGQAVCRDRPHRVLPRPRGEGQPLADERHVPAAERGAREEVRQGGDRGGSRRPEGAPLGRRACAPRSTTRSPRRASTRWSQFMREFERRNG